MPSPLITVITVVKNDLHGIEQTIKSVISQSYKYVQYIIVDGNSSDGTSQIIDQYKNVIDILIQEDDTGVYNAMNKGLRLAKGKLVNLLNSGDIYGNCDVLRLIANEYGLHQSCLIYGKARLLDCSIKRKKAIDYKYLGSKRLGKYCYNLCHQAMFYEYALHEKFGYYDERYKIAAEHKFTLDIVKKGMCEVLFIDENVVDYRGGGISAGPNSYKEYKLVDDEYFGRSAFREIKCWLKRQIKRTS